MRILILGGTRFLGRGLVEAAQPRGHTLTLFHRGTRRGLYPQVEEIYGDRQTDLSLLDGRTWDAVIDTSGYLPRVVRLSADALRGRVGGYTFISTLSVYAGSNAPDQDENAPLGTVADPTVEEITDETYGPLKVLCEQAVQERYPEQAFIPRPGLIVGRYDPTDRFTYWPVRVARGGEVLAPGRPGAAIQFIDVRDLSEWIIRQVEQGAGGVFNATGPQTPLPMGALLDACRDVSGSDARFAWAPERFLQEHNVQPWSELPAWLPHEDPETAGFFTIDCRKAQAAGLTYRPLNDTLADTLAWWRARPQDAPLRAGLAPEREAELLRALRAQPGEATGETE